MKTKPTTVDEYLKSLPDDRLKQIQKVRAVILKNLDRRFEEGIQYNCIGYYIPHKVYPNGYHCDPKQPLPFAALASNKSGMSLHLMCLYMNPPMAESLQAAAKKMGKKLDMGKACIRFKNADDLPLPEIGKLIKQVTVDEYVRVYEGALASRKSPAKKSERTSKSKSAR
jgi:hypothetical protein